MKHNSIAPLRSIPPIRRTLSAVSIALSLVFALAAFGVPLGTSWTYQGQLRRSGAAYNGTCNFQFSLWDAASGGALFHQQLPVAAGYRLAWSADGTEIAVAGSDPRILRVTVPAGAR